MRFFTVIPLFLATISTAFAAPIPPRNYDSPLVVIEKREEYLYRGTNQPNPEHLMKNLGLPKAEGSDHYIHDSDQGGISVTPNPSSAVLYHKYLWRQKKAEVEKVFDVMHDKTDQDPQHHVLKVPNGKELTHKQIQDHFNSWELVPAHERLEHAQKEGAHSQASENAQKVISAQERQRRGGAGTSLQAASSSSGSHSAHPGSAAQSTHHAGQGSSQAASAALAVTAAQKMKKSTRKSQQPGQGSASHAGTSHASTSQAGASHAGGSHPSDAHQGSHVGNAHQNPSRPASPAGGTHSGSAHSGGHGGH